tara:strand:- start:14 stop:229 length:216 start_codon:yes stop_codon:yes gene_type:complete
MAHLDFFPTEELIKELKKRYDDFVFLGNKKRTNTNDEYTVSFKGTYHGILGLVHMASLAAEAGEFDEHNPS